MVQFYYETGKPVDLFQIFVTRSVHVGIFVNPSNRKFQLSLNSEIYVDKSELLIHTNRLGQIAC